MKNKRIYYYLLNGFQILICLFFVSLVFIGKIKKEPFGILTNDIIKTVSIISFYCLTLLVLIEFCFKNVILKTIFLAIAFAGTLYLNTTKGINVLLFIYFLLGIALLLSSIIMLFLNENSNKKLPEMIFSVEHLKFTNFKFALGILLGIVLYYLFVDVLKYVMLPTLIIISCILFLVFIISSLLEPHNRLERKMQHQCNYSEYSASILKLLDNDNLHEESKAYLKLNLIDKMFFVNKEQALSELEKMAIPKNKLNNQIYHMLAVNYFVETNQLEKAKSELVFIKNEKQRTRFAQLIAVNNKEKVLLLETVPIEMKSNKLLSVSSLQLLMLYYFNQGQLEKSKKCALILNDNYGELLEVKKNVDDILFKINK